MELASYCHWLEVIPGLLFSDMLFQTCTYISNTIYRFRARCTFDLCPCNKREGEREREEEGEGAGRVRRLQGVRILLSLFSRPAWIGFAFFLCAAGSSYILPLIKNTICQCVGQVCVRPSVWRPVCVCVRVQHVFMQILMSAYAEIRLDMLTIWQRARRCCHVASIDIINCFQLKQNAPADRTEQAHTHTHTYTRLHMHIHIIHFATYMRGLW